MTRLLKFLGLFLLLSLFLPGCGGGGGGGGAQGGAPAGGGGNPAPGATTGAITGKLLDGVVAREVVARAADFQMFIEGTDRGGPVNSDGTFRLDNVPPGQYVLSARSGNACAVVVVTVAPGGVTDVGILRPRPSGAISGIVSGGGANLPLLGALVTAVPVATTNDAISDLPNGRPAFVAFTRPNGQYNMPALPPGTYMVTARLPGYVEASQTVAVVVAQVAAANFVLDPSPDGTGAVSGTVSTPVNGTDLPVSRALVVLRRPLPMPLPANPGADAALPDQLTVSSASDATPPSPGGRPVPIPQRPLFALTDVNGAFSIQAVPPGEYNLLVLKAGFAPLSKQITVKGGDKLTLSLALVSHSGRISGQVTDKSTTPIAGAGVVAGLDDPFAIPLGGGLAPASTASAIAQRPPFRQFALTDKQGNYTMLVPPGNFIVVAFAPGYGDVVQQTVVALNQSVTVNFQLAPVTPGQEGPIGGPLAPLLK